MANRFPLIIDSATNRIVELPATDNLDLAGSNISSVANITAGNSVSANFFVGSLYGVANIATVANSVAGANVSGQVGFAAVANSVAGANVSGQVGNALIAGTVTVNTQPNITSVGVLSSVTTSGNLSVTGNVNLTGSNVSLGAIGNVRITGGTSGQVVQTDGAGNLSFTTVSGAGISNGTSNVNIATSAGNVTIGVGGTANTVVFASASTTINTPIRTANTVIIGNAAGNTSLAITRGDIAIGYQSGTGARSGDATTAIGFQSGNVSQTQGAVAIGFQSGRTQGDASIAIGYQAGENQGFYSVAVGLFAGQSSQAGSAVAIGNQAGKTSQGADAVAIGTNAGISSQGGNSVAIGYNTTGTQGSVSIGRSARGGGGTTTGTIAIGQFAGNASMGNASVAIGAAAGQNGSTGDGAIAIGWNTARTSQKANAIAIGSTAGDSNQGVSSIAIGASAGTTNQANNSIIINATSSALEQTTANSFTVKPIRNATGGNVLYYDQSTGEITYSTPAAPTREYLFAYNSGTNVDLSTANTSLTMNQVGANTANVTYSTSTGNLLLPTGKVMRVSASGLSYLIPGQSTALTSDIRWVYAANNATVTGGVYTTIKGSDLTSGTASSQTGGYSLDIVLNLGVSANIKMVSRDAMTGVLFNGGQLTVTEI